MHTYDNISALLVFVTETRCVFCEIRAQAEGTVNDINMTAEHDRVEISLLTVSRCVRDIS
jgi:hypothetical protein